MSVLKKLLISCTDIFIAGCIITCTQIEFPTEDIDIDPVQVGPRITLSGPDPYYLNIGDTYVEPGATAYDSTDGDLTASIYIDKTPGDISTLVEQQYTVLYAVKNSKEESDSVFRTVIVQKSQAGDYSKPVITLLGDNPALVETGDTYTDAGATAEDAVDGNLTSQIQTFGAVINTAQLDTFQVWYMVLDNAGNVAYEIREVYVVTSTDREPPVIALEGPDPINLVVGYPYKEYGATAYDSVDGDLTSDIVIDASEVNTDSVGIYSVYYRVSDKAGNEAVEIRTVNVTLIPDTTAPVITLLGFNPYTQVINLPYEDSGATALDDIDGDITDRIVITGSVDIATFGTYTLQYNVSDQAGNAAVEKTRTVVVADTVKPVVTVNNPNPVNIQVGNPYVERGATAVDNYDGDLTHLLDTNATEVNASVIGTYHVYYTVTDNAGNTGQGIRVVNVLNIPDTTKPVITLSGANPMNLYVGDTFTEPGYTATDNVDGDITSSVGVTGDVNTAVAGTYTLHYNVSDQAGNAADEKTRTVSVTNAPDVEKPVITLAGANPMSVTVGDAYNEPGYTATDNVDGDITSEVVVTGNVNTAVEGTYTLRYNVSDQAGNAADEKTRTVNVTSGPDTEKPVITLQGPNPMTVSLGGTFTEPGYTALDNVDGDITNNVVVTGNVNTAVEGTYTLRYNVSDQAGNAADEKTRTVNVTSAPDTTKPVITLSGANPMDLNVGDNFTEPGYTATDDVDGDITSDVVVTGTVNTAVAGTYTRRYNVSDQAGNAADEKTRTVNVNAVPDTTKPVITLQGDNPMNLNVGDNFTDPGYTATDNVDGNITNNVVVTGTVNTAVAGTYTRRYNVSDQAGNAADEKTRTVNVNGGGPYPNWSHSRNLILNTSSGGANVSGTVNNFPVLIRLTSSNFTFSEARSDGGDIRFASSDGTPLSYEIEYWDNTNQRTWIWVLVDEIRGNNNSQYITMYWGNSAATSESSAEQAFRTASNYNFAGVWHLTYSGPFADATSNNNDATNNGSTDAISLIGWGQNFNGASYITAPTTASLDLTDRFTLSAWVRLTNTVNDQKIFGKTNTTSGYVFGVEADSLKAEAWDNTQVIKVAGGGSVAANQWVHLACTWQTNGNFIAYINGAQVASIAAGANNVGTNTLPLIIGAAPWDQTFFLVVGDIDEIRIANTNRSSSWLKLCYENQRASQTLVNFSK